MSSLLIVDSILLLLTLFLGVVAIGYTVFICKKLVPKIDYYLNGQNYDYDSWYAQLMRGQVYFTYSLLPDRARKAGVYDRFFSIPPRTRQHFLIWMAIAFFGGLTLVIHVILTYLFPELGLI